MPRTFRRRSSVLLACWPVLLIVLLATMLTVAAIHARSAARPDAALDPNTLSQPLAVLVLASFGAILLGFDVILWTITLGVRVRVDGEAVSVEQLLSRTRVPHSLIASVGDFQEAATPFGFVRDADPFGPKRGLVRSRPTIALLLRDGAEVPIRAFRYGPTPLGPDSPLVREFASAVAEHRTPAVSSSDHVVTERARARVACVAAGVLLIAAGAAGIALMVVLAPR